MDFIDQLFAFNFSRLHPLLVHLPIGIIFFAAFLFGMKKWKGTNAFDEAINWGLGLSALSAGFACLTGWFLSEEGAYEPDFLDWHKWLGLGTTFFFTVLFFLHKRLTNPNPLFSIFLGLALVLVSATGHFGGSLTHGADYLFKRAEKPKTIQFQDKNEIPVYEGIIQPILERKCIGCHNENKQKGELLMTTVAEMKKGGASGAIFDFLTPENSLLLRRIALPIEEDEHMPPKGKEQLLEAEISLLKWWIENGACTDCKAEEMKGKEQVNDLLDAYVKPIGGIDPSIIPVLGKETIKSIEELGFQLSSLSENSPLVSVKIPAGLALSRSMIRSLGSIKDNINSFDISEVQANNSLLGLLAEMKHLQVLKAARSGLKDGDLSFLSELEYLEVLNLYGTSISDVSISEIASLPSLKKLFVWQTAITESGLAELRKKKPKLEIDNGADLSFFEASHLNAPSILFDHEMFADSIRISLKNDFRNTSIYYTLDGTEPDSNSLLYVSPFLVTESLLLQAIALKDGWEPSPIARQQFIQYGMSIKEVILAKEPAEQYAGRGPKTLIDLDKSIADFRNGKWLGYQGQHVKLNLELDELTSISKLFVSSISEPNSWIFYPQGATISVSEDGVNFQEVKQQSFDRDHRTGTEMDYFVLSFEPKQAKFIQLEIESMLENPEWHSAPGGKCWLFIDEVILN